MQQPGSTLQKHQSSIIRCSHLRLSSHAWVVSLERKQTLDKHLAHARHCILEIARHLEALWLGGWRKKSHGIQCYGLSSQHSMAPHLKHHATMCINYVSCNIFEQGKKIGFSKTAPRSHDVSVKGVVTYRSSVRGAEEGWRTSNIMRNVLQSDARLQSTTHTISLHCDEGPLVLQTKFGDFAHIQLKTNP